MRFECLFIPCFAECIPEKCVGHGYNFHEMCVSVPGLMYDNRRCAKTMFCVFRDATVKSASTANVVPKGEKTKRSRRDIHKTDKYR